ncbi:MAG TPA: class I SAM-dependent methyltransferase [Kofleriaceae bacterium]|jgi:23S rRNA (cytosine1962-C5)-methyltransferase
MKARRYQLRKEAVGVVAHHPWVFRDHLSSAAGALHDGEWLRLVDGQNRVVGYGIYAAEGAIAIRVLRRGAEVPDAAFLRARIGAALSRRGPLAAKTDGIRLLNGESDSIPAIVADRFGDAIVVSSYASGADALARYVARYLAAIAHRKPIGRGKSGATATAAITDEMRRVVGPATSIVLERAQRRHAAHADHAANAHVDHAANADADHAANADADAAARELDAAPSDHAAPRALFGTPPALGHFTEDGLTFSVDLATGQKTGAYLDLRGLRRMIATAPLSGARVLNLFAYTGMLGRAAEAAGAAHITEVDASAPALAFAAAHHAADPAKHEYVIADIFEWLATHDGTYDLVIVDPPAMTSRAAQVPAVLAAYRKLFRAAAPRVRHGGALVAACCTSRIPRAQFQETVVRALGTEFGRERELPVELDHPVGFPQADYLKIGWYRRAQSS